MDPIPFVPVKYQGTLDDGAASLFAMDGVYRIEVDVADELFDDDNEDGVDYTYLASDKTSPAVFTFYTDEYGTGTPLIISGIGMRLRGGWSFLNHKKKKYKIAFPEGDDRFYGLRKINLNSNFGENSMIREKLAYELFNIAGVPSGRATYTRLYMNGNYMGLYLIVEQMGNDYVKARFGSPVGNCYKVNWSDLTWAPANVSDYIPSSANKFSPSLEIMTNEDTFSPADVQEFITVLNTTPDDGFEAAIKEKFHVYEYLNVLAMNALLGLIDDYWYYAHNFFLYNYYGKIMWIPWDLDSSLGVNWSFITVTTADLFTFMPRSNTEWDAGIRPLIDRVLAVPAFYDYYRKCLKYHLEHYFNETFLYPRIDKLKALIHDAALSDPLQGLTEWLFNDSFDGIHTWEYGVRPYIMDRRAYALPIVQDAY